MAVSPTTITGSDVTLKDTTESQQIYQISQIPTHDEEIRVNIDTQSVESGCTERRLSYSSGSSGSAGSSVVSSPSSYESTTSFDQSADAMDQSSAFKQRAIFPLEIYGMTHSWLFLVETLLQLLAFSAMASAEMRNHLNMVCNVIYSLLYASILASYILMETPPSLCCIFGVFLYWIGYVAFLALYSVDLWSTNLSSIAPLYYAGSWLFLSGSAFLIKSTAGISWWGSIAFGIGSLFFVMDAHGVGSGYLNGTIGLATFLIGRFCFVFASRTERVGLCSIKLNHSTKSMTIPSLPSLSSSGQHLLHQITLIMDDERKGDPDSTGKMYVEMSLLENMRVKDVPQLISRPFSLGKVEEVFTFVSRCGSDKSSHEVSVMDEEQAVKTKDL